MSSGYVNRIRWRKRWSNFQVSDITCYQVMDGHSRYISGQSRRWRKGQVVGESSSPSTRVVGDLSLAFFCRSASPTGWTLELDLTKSCPKLSTSMDWEGASTYLTNSPMEVHNCLLDSLRGSSVKIGTIQRRLAWPLCKDDTHKSGN